MKEQIEFVKSLVDEHLIQLFDQSNATPKLVEAMRYSAVDGGKRIRPFLIYCWGNVFNCDVNRLLPLMSAVELVHAYSLVHDDLPALDNSSLRRGKPSSHITFGESTALLAGSSLYTLGLEQITKSDYDLTVQHRLLMDMFNCSGGEGFLSGQILDLRYTMDESTVTLRDIEHMQDLKTGRLITWSCLAPALIAKAQPDQLSLIKSFAYKLGLLYQLTDDLLDLTGQENILGKPICKDLENNKINFISILGVKATQEKIQLLYKEANEILTHFHRPSLLGDLLKFIVRRTH